MTSNTEPEPKHCRTCGAEILFVPTAEGKPMPLNLPGQVRWLVGQDGIGRRVFVYETHFATCPQSKAWSEGRVSRR
jgi:hypothetical protein